MRSGVALALLLLTSRALAQGQSELEHVPPAAPATHVHAMPYDEMAEMMGMDDRKRFAKVMLDRLEWHGEPSGYEWEAAAWYGGDVHKLWLESEGEHDGRSVHEARVELLWDRILTPWWSTRLGLRQDLGEGPDRSWLAFGFAGLAPGFIEFEASAYLGESGRSALRLAAHYDLLITQRLVLQPEAEVNAYGRDDPERGIASGISDLELGLRLRYELRREVAPYMGVGWARRLGASADLARAAGDDPDDLLWLAGIRLWF